MDVDQDRLVDALGAAIRNGGAALGDVPELLKRVLTEGVWRDFTTRRRQVVHHDRFADFITTQPLAGLGSSIDLVRRIVAADIEALDLLDRELQNPHGGDQSKSNNVTHAPAGNSKERALRRLRKDAPELHADVLAGRISAHAAMVRAGFRPETFSIRADPVSAVRTLRRHMTREQLSTLVLLLQEG